MSARPLTDAEKQERYRLQRIAHGAALNAPGYRDLAEQAVAGSLTQPGPWTAACAAADPNYRCGACRCWKLQREYCS